jgi:hypothetical protein
MLDTALQPYTDVADLFVIDPDGFVIRFVYNTRHDSSGLVHFSSEREGFPSNKVLDDM